MINPQKILAFKIALLIPLSSVCAQSVTSIAEAEAAVVLAKSQIKEKEFEEAISNLLQVLESKVPPTESAWVAAVSPLARLASTFPPARDEYERLRKNAKTTWEDFGTPESLAAYFELNHYGRYETENLELFDSLEPDKKEHYKKRLFRVFWNYGRYEDFLSSIDPVERLEGQISTYEKVKSMSEQNDRFKPMISKTRDSILLVSSQSLEAMLRTERKEEAILFGQRILDFEESDQTKELIRIIAQKTGYPEIMNEL